MAAQTGNESIIEPLVRWEKRLRENLRGTHALYTKGLTSAKMHGCEESLRCMDEVVSTDTGHPGIHRLRSTISQRMGNNPITLHHSRERPTSFFSEPCTFSPTHFLRPMLFLVVNAGWFKLRRSRRKEETKRGEESTSKLEGAGEERAESEEPIYEMKWKRVTEMQTKFISMMIDEAHEVYLQKARPPEDVKRLLDSHVNALKREIVSRLRQGE